MSRENQYEYVLINSRNRRNAETTDAGDCSISFGQKALPAGRYAIVSGFIHNTPYTFDSFTSTSGEVVANNQIVFNDGKDCVAEIDPGYYDTDSLPAAIKSAMDDAGSQTYTVTLNKNNTTNNKLTIEASSNFTMTYATSTVIGLRQNKSGANSYLMDVPFDTTANFQAALITIGNATTISVDFKSSDNQGERPFTLYYSMEETAFGEMRSISKDEVPFNFEIPDTTEFRVFVRNQAGELVKFNQGGWQFLLKKIKGK